MRRFFSFLARLVGVVVILGIPAGLAYLTFFGFDADFRRKVADAIGGSVFAVDIERLTFNPFQGLVAEGISVSQKLKDPLQVASVDQLIISVNLAELLRGRVSIDLLDLDNATVSIPFADDGQTPDVIALENLDARILNSAGRLTISEAECDVLGIHVSLTGELLNPSAGIEVSPSEPEDPEKRIAMIRSILSVVDEVSFPDSIPHLSVRLTGDLSNSESIGAPAITFNSGKVDFRGLHFDRLDIRGSYLDRIARLQQLVVAGEKTNLHVSGRWNFESSSGEGFVAGSVNVTGLLRVMKRDDLANQLTFETSPQIDAQVTASPGADGLSVMANGDVRLGKSTFKGIAVDSLTTAFAWKDSRLFVQDAVIATSSGSVRTSIMYAPDDFRVKLDSDALPSTFAPLFGPNERKILDLLEFKDVPKVVLSLSGPAPKTELMRGEGTIKLGRTAMRGSWIDSATSDVVFEDRAVLYRDFTARKDGGKATGSFTYDFGRREVRLDDVKSDLDPVGVLMWVDPRVAQTVAVYRFHEPPNVTADGLVHMEKPSENNLRITVDAPGGLDYELLNRDLSFGATEAKVHLKGQHVLASVGETRLMGGNVSVEADVSTNPKDPVFGASIECSNIDFPALTKLYFGYSKSEGRMSGSYRFDAALRDPGSMKGKGSIRVEDGHVLAIPLFGPLSDVISAIIPGVGHDSARLATADFTIANNKVTTNNLDIQGQGFEMFGEGDIGFPSGKLDLAVRINARGIPGIVLFPVSKLLEYVSTGTMSDPQWRPKIVPKEFFDILGMGGQKDPPRKSPTPRTSR